MSFGLQLRFGSVWKPTISDKMKNVHLELIIHCLLAVSNKHLPIVFFNKNAAVI